MLTTPAEPFHRFLGEFPTYPELRGRRVLVTGVTADHGVDIARAFAEHGARLIVQASGTAEETAALGEMLAPTAAELSLHDLPLDSVDAVVAFARRAMAEFGGIDAVVNVVPLEIGAATGEDLEALEQRISDVLTVPCLIARVAANRVFRPWPMLDDGEIVRGLHAA